MFDKIIVNLTLRAESRKKKMYTKNPIRCDEMISTAIGGEKQEC